MAACFDADKNVYIRLDSLNTSAFFVTKCLDVTVFEGVCLPQHIHTLPSFDQVALTVLLLMCCSVVPSVLG